MRAHACTRQRSEGAQPHVSASLCHRLITSSEHGCLEERHSTTCGRPIMSPSRRPNGASRRVSSVKGTRVRVGCSGDPLEALPRALCLASQISSMDEIWLRGAGSTHNEPHAAAQRCQPTPAVGLGCLGTGGSLRRPPRSLAACARPREPNLVHRRNLASPPLLPVPLPLPSPVLSPPSSRLATTLTVL